LGESHIEAEGKELLKKKQASMTVSYERVRAVIEIMLNLINDSQVPTAPHWR